MLRYGTILFVSIPTALFGFYESRGNPDKADCVMGHSFGTDISEQSVNRQLVDTMKQSANGRPIIADRMLVRADPEGEKVYALWAKILGKNQQADLEHSTADLIAKAENHL